LFPPYFSPADLIQIRRAFDDPGFIFELKHDGFRAARANSSPDPAMCTSRSGRCARHSR
jgi:hypothetical protein